MRRGRCRCSCIEDNRVQGSERVRGTNRQMDTSLDVENQVMLGLLLGFKVGNGQEEARGGGGGANDVVGCPAPTPLQSPCPRTILG